jgi:regulatory protein
MSWQRKPDSAQDPLDESAARRLAMNLLARREHSRKELIAKLGQRNIRPETLNSTIDRLTAEGLQSDSRFAESYAHNRMQRGQGPARIRKELEQRGVSAEQIDAAIAGLQVDWRRLAQDVRQSKFGSRAPGRYKDKARQSRFLQYRGFTHDQIRAAVAAGAGTGDAGDTDIGEQDE